MISYLTLALQQLRPGAEFTYKNDDYATIEWHKLEGEPPTQAEVNGAIEEIKAKEAQGQAEAAAKREALLDRLGITEEEAKLLLG